MLSRLPRDGTPIEHDDVATVGAAISNILGPTGICICTELIRKGVGGVAGVSDAEAGGPFQVPKNAMSVGHVNRTWIRHLFGHLICGEHQIWASICAEILQITDDGLKYCRVLTTD